jgi:hypothetical protein
MKKDPGVFLGHILDNIELIGSYSRGKSELDLMESVGLRDQIIRRIEISNPGGLPMGLSPEEFGKRSVLRNPKIAGMLHRADYIEKMGTGVRKMQRLMSEAALPPLEFTFTSFLRLRSGS